MTGKQLTSSTWVNRLISTERKEISPFLRDFRYSGPTSGVTRFEDTKFNGYPQELQLHEGIYYFSYNDREREINVFTIENWFGIFAYYYYYQLISKQVQKTSRTSKLTMQFVLTCIIKIYSTQSKPINPLTVPHAMNFSTFLPSCLILGSCLPPLKEY